MERTSLLSAPTAALGALLKLSLANGASVIAHARTRTEEFESVIASLQDRYGRTISPAYFDLTDSPAMKAFVKDLMSRKVAVDT